MSTIQNNTDTQALNDIKAISAQITATNNPTELRRLAGQAESLKSDNQFINDIIEKVQNIIAKKQEALETYRNSEIYQKELEELQKQSQREEVLAKTREEIAEKIAIHNKAHNEFILRINKNIKDIEKSNKRLDTVIDKLEKENIFDHEELHHEILTHEEISNQHENHKQHYKHQRKIDEEHKCVYQELNELNKEITNIKQQLQKKDLDPKKINELKQELEFHQEMLKIRKPYAEQLNKDKKEFDQEIIEHEKARKVQGEKIEKLRNIIKIKNYTKDSDEYNKYQALKRQHKAIETNGIVKDKEHHDKVLAKTKIYKMRKQAQVNNSTGSLYPSRTPNNSTNNKTRGI